MALTIAIEGLGVISDAESITNWGITGSGGASFASDTEIYYQGSACNSTALSSGKYGWLWYNNGSAINFNTTYVGQRVYIWFNCTTPGKMNTLANAGLAVRMGSSTTVFRTWTLAGSDDLNGYKGGWRCAVIDPTLPGSISDTGSYSAASVQYIGIYYNGSGASRSNNVFVDTIAVGKGIRVYGTSSTMWGDIVTYCAGTLATRAWGMVQQREGIYYMYGSLFIGGNASNDTVASSSGKVIKFGDSQYYYSGGWVTSVGNSFNGLTIEDHASHKTEYTDGVLVGSDAGRSGNVYIGAGSINTTFDVYGGNHASSLTYLYGCVLQAIDGGFTWGNDADHRCYSVTFSGCTQVDPVGAPKLRNCLFISTTSTSGALLWNESIDISSCRFIANTTGAAIKMPSAAGTPYAYNALFFSGNTYDVNNTSGSSLTINKNSLSDPTTYTGSTVTFAGTSVTTSITVSDVDTGALIMGARVLVLVASGVNYPYQATVTITGSGTTATVTHSAHGLATNDNVYIYGADQDVYNGCFPITYISSSSYSYTTPATISVTPATGTIKATMALINKSTASGTGIVSDTRSLGNDQPITGWVRKATYGPSYTGGSWDDTALTLTKTGAFAGQFATFSITIISGTNMTAGEYLATRVSNDAVTLVGTAGSANSSDVVFTIGSSTYYKQAPISDTVDKNLGKSINVQLIPDV
jgi:hypothetical protein